MKLILLLSLLFINSVLCVSCAEKKIIKEDVPKPAAQINAISPLLFLNN